MVSRTRFNVIRTLAVLFSEIGYKGITLVIPAVWTMDLASGSRNGEKTLSSLIICLRGMSVRWEVQLVEERDETWWYQRF